MDSLRLFIALWPSPAARQAVLAWRDRWTWPPQARLVAADRLHLTLHFLGQVPAGRLPELAAALQVNAPALELQFDCAEVWPNGVALLRPSATPAALHALHTALADVLTRLGLHVEARRFKPHLTLARQAAGAVPPADPVGVSWPVAGYDLVQSIPGSGGGYVRLVSYPCAAWAPNDPAAATIPSPPMPRATMPDFPTDPCAPPDDAAAAHPEIAPAAADAAAGGVMPATPTVPDLSPAACAARLAELFPALFAPEGPPKPLKLRIQADIQSRAPGVFTKRALSVFLSRYTTGNAYIKALLQAPHRFDLDGQPAGEISEEHRTAATQELARRRTLHDARRAAERAAWREQDKAARQAQRAQVADDQARRERAFLLRAFETSTLTKANFCALKGLSEADLEGQLALARTEREQRPPRDAQGEGADRQEPRGGRRSGPGGRPGAPRKPGR